MHWRLDQAAVDRQIGFPDGQRDHGSDAGCRIGVAVDLGVAAYHLQRDGISRQGLDELDAVVTRIKIIKEVQSVAVGLLGRQDIATSVEQVDRDVLDTRFIDVLQAVGVYVEPHEVAKLGGLRWRFLNEAGIDGGIQFTDRQSDDATEAGRRVRVAIELVVAADIGCREHEVTRRLELNSVAAGVQACERIQAVRIGGCALDESAGAVEQRDLGDDAWLAGVLQAVGVLIPPHEVTESGGLWIAAGIIPCFETTHIEFGFVTPRQIGANRRGARHSTTEERAQRNTHGVKLTSGRNSERMFAGTGLGAAVRNQGREFVKRGEGIRSTGGQHNPNSSQLKYLSYTSQPVHLHDAPA